KKLALKRYIQTSEKGIKLEDLLNAVREEFKENEDLPNTTNPDDWAKIAGKKGERIVYVKPLMAEVADKQRRAVDRVVPTGQYLSRLTPGRSRSARRCRRAQREPRSAVASGGQVGPTVDHQLGEDPAGQRGELEPVSRAGRGECDPRIAGPVIDDELLGRR